jgi:hypothetical protein
MAVAACDEPAGEIAWPRRQRGVVPHLDRGAVRAVVDLDASPNNTGAIDPAGLATNPTPNPGPRILPRPPPPRSDGIHGARRPRDQSPVTDRDGPIRPRTRQRLSTSPPSTFSLRLWAADDTFADCRGESAEVSPGFHSPHGPDPHSVGAIENTDRPGPSSCRSRRGRASPRALRARKVAAHILAGPANDIGTTEARDDLHRGVANTIRSGGTGPLRGLGGPRKGVLDKMIPTGGYTPLANPRIPFP